jgi:hypothetical protein
VLPIEAGTKLEKEAIIEVIDKYKKRHPFDNPFGGIFGDGSIQP